MVLLDQLGRRTGRLAPRRIRRDRRQRVTAAVKLDRGCQESILPLGVLTKNNDANRAGRRVRHGRYPGRERAGLKESPLRIGSGYSREMSKILIITGDGGESYEALYAVHRFEDVRVEEYRAVLVLGGRAPEYLRNNARVIEIVREFDRQGKWVFAICHGVQILAAAGLARGKRVTCYEHVRLEAEQAGGTFVDEQTVRDGRIVTAQTWQSHPSFYREIFAQLTGNASAARS